MLIKRIIDSDFKYYVGTKGLQIFIKDDPNDSLSMEGYFRDSKGFLNMHDNDTCYYSKDITYETLMDVIYRTTIGKTQSLDISEKLDIINFYRNVSAYGSENWVEDKDTTFKIEKGNQNINIE